jgi:hypothetical protein
MESNHKKIVRINCTGAPQKLIIRLNFGIDFLSQLKTDSGLVRSCFVTESAARRPAASASAWPLAALDGGERNVGIFLGHFFLHCDENLGDLLSSRNFAPAQN